MQLGWFFPKNSVLAPLFNRYMLELSERGLIQGIRNKYVSPLDKCKALEFSPVNFSLVRILFIVLTFGIIIACVISTIERLLKRKMYALK